MSVTSRRRRSRDRTERIDIREQMRMSAAQTTEDVESRARPMRDYAMLVPEPGLGPLRFDDFPFQEAWYSEEVARAKTVVWMKASQVGMCLAGSTRILTDDLRWVSLDEVAPGQRIMAVDEGHGSVCRGRRVRVATIERKWRTRQPAFQLFLSNGVEVTASADHRWLCQQRGGNNTGWRPVRAIRVGDRIRSVVQPWGEPTYDDGWMGGILDGEGFLRKKRAGAELVITQQVGAVYDRAARYLADGGFSFRHAPPRMRPGGPVGRLVLSRSNEVLRLIGLTRPTRMVGAAWWHGMAPPGMREDAWPTVLAIEPVGERGLIDLQTSTGTFVAEGLVSHNSAYAWRWGMRQCDQFGHTTLYIFPTDTHVTEFGDERIEPAIAESSYLSSRIQARFVRHKRLKRIGRGFLHLRGSNSKAGAQSVAAQDIVFDEYDYLDPANLPQIERRISGAKQIGREPRTRRLGYPTIEGYGIAELYEHTDQRVWIVTCDGCGLEQQLSWEENVRWVNEPEGETMRAGGDDYRDPNRVERAWRACKGCELELDVAHGRWVAQRPDASVVGFHVPRLIVPMTDLEEIVRASRKTGEAHVQTFENLDLARPYSAGEAGLDAASILRACALGGPMVEGYAGGNPVTMGVDVAGERDLNVRISEQLPTEFEGVPNARRALWIGRVKSFTDLERLMARFRVDMCAIDSNPERRMAKALRTSFPGQVVLVEYDHRDDSDAIKVKEQGPPGTALDGVPLTVRVNRTEAIDAMMDSVRQARNRPLAEPPATYIDQMRALRRRVVIASNGRPRREYVTTGSSGDDYAHAEVYDLVATELWRARTQLRAMSGPPRHVPDEEVGFRRVRLTGDTDEYRAGFDG